MLVDVMSLGVTGKEAEQLLDEIGITVNKNQIPFDGQPANTSSGIRVGTPAVTSRGMGSDEMREIGRLIIEAIERRDDAAEQAAPGRSGREICGRFPVPGLRRPRRFRRGCRRREVQPLRRSGAPVHCCRVRRGGGARVRPHATRPADRPPVDAVDHPDQRRVNVGPHSARRRRGGGDRLHPRGDGLGLANGDSHFLPVPRAVDPASVVALLLGGALAAAFGVLDDYFDLRARWQFAGQLATRAVRGRAWGSLVELVNNPFGPGVDPARRPVRRSGSRSSGSRA